MKILYLIRGVPGAGKSTLANQLTPHVCEADQFMINSLGQYAFDRAKLKQCHEACQVLAESLMSVGYETIAVANTFIKRWEMQPYIQLANKYGYKVIELSLTGEPFLNVHGVPADTIERMARGFEL